MRTQLKQLIEEGSRLPGLQQRKVGCLVTVNIRAGRTGPSCTGVLLTRHHVLSPQDCAGPGVLVNRRTTTRPGSDNLTPIILVHSHWSRPSEC